MAAEKEIPYETKLPVEDLLLDDQNPRLPEDLLGAEQNLLIQHMVDDYDAITVARSISLHGYFLSEPLIVENKTGKVFEGNRRLAAVKLLSNSSLLEELELVKEDEWEDLAEGAEDIDLAEVPVIVVADRRSVAPIIGYRHISGIEPWDPWAKARFITQLIEDDLTFDDVADEVGESANEVKANYRNYQVMLKAREAGLDAERIEDSFGVFTRAMTSGPLRKHVGLPAPSEIQQEQEISIDENLDELKELIEWLFGSDAAEAVIGESRDISRLGKVVDSDAGLEVLRGTRDLEEAFIAAGGLRDRLIKRLSTAETHLRKSEEDFPLYLEDSEVLDLVEQCQSAIDNLNELTNKAD